MANVIFKSYLSQYQIVILFLIIFFVNTRLNYYANIHIKLKTTKINISRLNLVPQNSSYQSPKHKPNLNCRDARFCALQKMSIFAEMHLPSESN